MNTETTNHQPPNPLIAFLRMFLWELKLEFRSFGSLIAVLPYAATLAVLFHFSLSRDVFDRGENVMGLLLLSLFFIVVMMTARSSGRERESGGFRILFMTGISRSSYLFARVAVKSLVVILILAVYALLYNVLVVGTNQFFLLSTKIVVLLLPCTVNLILLGEVVSILATGNRIREVVLPVLFLPLSLPIFFMYSAGVAVVDGRANVFGYGVILVSMIALYGGAATLFLQFLATDEM